MAFNYAEKYSEIIDERFTTKALTEAAVNKDYEFSGVNKVNVYSVNTVPLGDYVMEGTNRYGKPEELRNDKTEFTLTQDKAFTFTIDLRHKDSTMMTMEAGRALAREIDEVIVPTVDKYRLQALCNDAGTVKNEVITKDNAYTSLLDGTTTLIDSEVPADGRILYLTPAFYKMVKIDPLFIKNCETAQKIAITGSVGMIDGMNIIVAPTHYLETGVNFIITHPMAMTSPKKISEYKIHDNPPGINGWLVEGRIVYDAFVIPNKKKAVYVSRNSK